MHPHFVARAAAQLLKNAPNCLAQPLALVPFPLKQQVLQWLSRNLLQQAATHGGLDFLVGRWVAINITDLQFCFEVSYQGKFKVRPSVNPDVTFSASSDDLLLIAAGVEDPDSLFFQRRLSIEGNTELGLQLKNLMLSLDTEQQTPLLRSSLQSLSQLLLWLRQQAQPAYR